MAVPGVTTMKLGDAAPDFALPDTDGRVVKRSEFAGRPLLVMFICNHCPYVKHAAKQMKALGDDYADALGIVAINANDPTTHPDDAPDKMAGEKASRGYGFPYLFDATQAVAKAYTAACTPDFFLFDAEHRLAYHGQLDDTRPGRIASGVYDFDKSPADGADLRAAIDAVLSGKKPGGAQKPSMGCNVKWKSGNAPAYA